MVRDITSQLLEYYTECSSQVARRMTEQVYLGGARTSSADSARGSGMIHGL